MKEVEESVYSLIGAIKKQECFKKYHEMLNSIREDPELFSRLNEFRRKNMEIHLRKSTLEEQSALRKEYDDILMQEKIDQFLYWEQKVVIMFQTVYDLLADEIELDYSFLK